MADVYKTLIFNGKTMGVRAETMSYEEAVELSLDKPVDSMPMFTVTYRSKKGAMQGTLTPGESVPLQDGMVFNVALTDNA